MPDQVGLQQGDSTPIKGTGFITRESEAMANGVEKSKTQLEEIKEKLRDNPSDPSILAGYQAALSEYNLYRNAQSNMVKAYKDIGSSIITNFKN